MTAFEVVTANTLDRQKLLDFLTGAYGATKGSFLVEYGAWWYGGEQNRLAVVMGSEIIAYCGIIPTTCMVQGRATEAIWWVDLFVAPAFRGRGVQSLLDQALRSYPDLKLGFPNALAAKIHLKHGWGMYERGYSLLLPLSPTRLRSIRRLKGYKGLFFRVGALCISPVAALVRYLLVHYRPATARRLLHPDAMQLASVFLHTIQEDIVTTTRGADFLQWRFFDAPYYSELDFYVAGESHAPSLALITRKVDDANGKLLVLSNSGTALRW